MAFAGHERQQPLDHRRNECGMEPPDLRRQRSGALESPDVEALDARDDGVEPGIYRLSCEVRPPVGPPDLALAHLAKRLEHKGEAQAARIAVGCLTLRRESAQPAKRRICAGLA